MSSTDKAIGVVGLKSWKRRGSCNLSIRSCNFQPEKFTGAQNFNLSPTFSRNGHCQSQILYFEEKDFRQAKIRDRMGHKLGTQRQKVTAHHHDQGC